jgi:hypothetical protein
VFERLDQVHDGMEDIRHNERVLTESIDIIATGLQQVQNAIEEVSHT